MTNLKYTTTILDFTHQGSSVACILVEGRDLTGNLLATKTIIIRYTGDSRGSTSHLEFGVKQGEATITDWKAIAKATSARYEKAIGIINRYQDMYDKVKLEDLCATAQEREASLKNSLALANMYTARAIQFIKDLKNDLGEDDFTKDNAIRNCCNFLNTP